MTEKVKVSREIAKELGQVKQPSVVVFKMANTDPDEYKIRFGDLTFDELIRALYIGYEIKLTPEENVKEYFDSWNKPVDGIYHSNWSSEQSAIIGTLNRLDIKIKGVNVC